jgi:hypothetical protein
MLQFLLRAVLLIPGNSGRIVGRTRGRAAARAGFGLRLAALEVFPQRRPQALLLPRLVRAFSSIVAHDAKPAFAPLLILSEKSAIFRDHA